MTEARHHIVPTTYNLSPAIDGALLPAPTGREEKFIILPGEAPWWEIEDCKERARAFHRQEMRMWYKLHPDADAEAMRRFYKSHPGCRVESRKRHEERHPGTYTKLTRESRQRHPETLRRYYGTPRGKAARAKEAAKRRKHSTDPALYAARVYLLHDLQESCAVCGVPYDTTHQIDHIVALCLGGTDDWDNLQPLCILCHREKTKEDIRELLRARVAEIRVMAGAMVR